MEVGWSLKKNLIIKWKIENQKLLLKCSKKKKKTKKIDIFKLNEGVFNNRKWYIKHLFKYLNIIITNINKNNNNNKNHLKKLKTNICTQFQYSKRKAKQKQNEAKEGNRKILRKCYKCYHKLENRFEDQIKWKHTRTYNQK